MGEWRRKQQRQNIKVSAASQYSQKMKIAKASKKEQFHHIQSDKKR